MFAFMRALFGKADSSLPAEVAGALAAARYIARPSDDDEGPRVLVVLAGGGVRGGFFFSRDEAKMRVLRRWPELTPAQVKRCISAIEAGVINASRLDSPPKNRNWVMGYLDDRNGSTIH